jgi:ATP-dependent exoDNAse (exonuclease V) beta subunit
VKSILENISPLPRSETPEWKRATDFIEQDKEAKLFVAPPSSIGTISPLVRGSVLHRCLEDLTRSGPPDIDRIIQEFPGVLEQDTEVREAFQNDIKTVLHAVTTDKTLAWIFDSNAGEYSELPFLYKKGNTFVSGIIDRVVVKDNKGYVVDYKHSIDMTRWPERPLPSPDTHLLRSRRRF